MVYIIGGIFLLSFVAWMLGTLRSAWLRADEMEAKAQVEHVKKMAEKKRHRAAMVREACKLSRELGKPADEILDILWRKSNLEGKT